MESSFFVEAKSFLFLVAKRSEVLRVVEKRKGFSGTMLLGSRCVAWLLSMVEEVLRSKITDDFENSFKEDSKVTFVWGRGNKSGRFLEVYVNAKGGRRGMILFPEG
jgi:predicted DNA-binding transcriptional regulator AlpA